MSEERMPIGAWLQLELPNRPVVAFTYVDPQAGFSTGGFAADGSEP